jgi:hypothetical protein
VVVSQFFWTAALQQLTGLVADGTWVPMAAVHFAAVTAMPVGLRGSTI